MFHEACCKRGRSYDLRLAFNVTGWSVKAKLLL